MGRLNLKGENKTKQKYNPVTTSEQAGTVITSTLPVIGHFICPSPYLYKAVQFEFLIFTNPREVGAWQSVGACLGSFLMELERRALRLTDF